MCFVAQCSRCVWLRSKCVWKNSLGVFVVQCSRCVCGKVLKVCLCGSVLDVCGCVLGACGKVF
jgi:hypothetical protein